MAVRLVEVGIAADAIEQIARVPVERAIEELIWNALDAEAHTVEVIFSANQLDAIQRVIVKDNGHGIACDQVESIFSNVGASQKVARRRSPNLDRPYHGKEGKGRYKAFSIGQTVRWQSRTMDKGKVHEYSVCVKSITIKQAEITSPVPCEHAPGCEVIIEDTREHADRLRSAVCIETLSHRLAPYLMAHPDIKIIYDGTLLDIKELLLRDESFDMRVEMRHSVPPILAKMRILEWKKVRKPSLFYCDGNGVALDEVAPGVREGRFSFTAYVLSDKLREFHDLSRKRHRPSCESTFGGG